MATKKIKTEATIYQSPIQWTPTLTKYLTVMNLPNDIVETYETKKRIHHIQVIDRSASMADEIDDLLHEVSESLDLIENDDIMSVYWYSSSDEYGQLISRCPMKSSYESEKKCIKASGAVFSTTCYADVMEQILCDCSKDDCIVDATEISLFTDGECSSDFTDDSEVVESCIAKMVSNPRINLMAFNAIGYGNNVDYARLDNWVSLTRLGVLHRAPSIKSYISMIRNNMNASATYSNGATILMIRSANDNDEIVYCQNSNAFSVYNHTEQLFRMDPKKNQVIILSDTAYPAVTCSIQSSSHLKVVDSKLLLESSIVKKIPQTNIEGYLYKIAYAATNDSISQYIVNTILKDSALHNSRVDAWTPSDRVLYKKEILRKAAFSRDRRHANTIRGVPSKRPSVISILELLKSLKDQFKYIPEKSKYVRIGKSSDNLINVHTVSSYAQFNDIVYNNERINVSIRFSLDAYAPISDKDAKTLGYDGMHDLPVRLYRTHTIIKDGMLNVSSITLSGCTKTALQEIKMLCGSHARVQGRSLQIDLTKLPLFDTSVITADTADCLYDCVHSLVESTAKAKAYKAWLEDHPLIRTKHYKQISMYDFSESEKQILKKYGITPHSDYLVYNGVILKSAIPAKYDTYMAPVMKVYLKGHSEIKSVSAAFSAKSPNTLDQLMIDTYNECEHKSEDINDLLRECKLKISEANKTLMSIRAYHALRGFEIPEFTYDTQNNKAQYKDIIVKYGWSEEKVTIN